MGNHNIIPNIPFEPNPPTKQLRRRETNLQSIKIDNRLRFSYKIRSKFKELKTLLKQQQYIIVQWIYLRINHLHLQLRKRYSSCTTTKDDEDRNQPVRGKTKACEQTRAQ